jgi:hypothetical protein
MRNDLVEQLGLQGLGDGFSQATDQEISNAETYFQHSLPNEYKFFLKNYGASLFSEEVAFKVAEASPWTTNGSQTLDVFYGLSKDPRFDLVCIGKRIGADLPDGMIAIGHDAGSSHILLRLNDGHIFFCDKDSNKTYLIAQSFASFLDSFYKI